MKKFSFKKILCNIFNSNSKAPAPKNNSILIETPRLTLRDFMASDATRLQEMTSAEGFKYYCFDGTQEKVDAFLTKCIKSQTELDANGNRANVMLAIADKATGNLIGHVSLEKVALLPDYTHEVNFFVDMAYQNKGYGREAAVNIQLYGLEDMGMPGYNVTIHPQNGPSLRVAEKEGYRKVGETTLETTRGTEPRLILVLTKDEYYAQRKLDTQQMLLPTATAKNNPPKQGM